MSAMDLTNVSVVTAVKCTNCNRESPAEIIQLSIALELGLLGKPAFITEVVAYRIRALEPDWFWTVNEDGRFFMYLCPQCVHALGVECDCTLDKAMH